MKKKRARERDSTSNTMAPLPENPNSAGKLSPVNLRSRNRKNMKKSRVLRTSKKKEKNRSSSSVQKITKESFDADEKSSAAGGGEVSNSSAWVKTRFLGQGACGFLYLARSKNEEDRKEEVAIKTAELSQASCLMDEGRILIRLDSPFIVRCYGGEIAREETGQDLSSGDCMHFNLILECCSGLTLADLLDRNHGGLLEFHVKLFARDVLSGLRYIHDRNIIHCDIKPENLLLYPFDSRLRPNGYWTKLGDFSLALEKGSIAYGNGLGHERGSTPYMAPELISHGFVDFGVDMWAFGCTVLEMLTGKVAWGEHGDLGSKDWVNLIGHSDLIPHIPDCLSEEARDFLSKCLERDIYKRWSSHSLANHSFVTL